MKAKMIAGAWLTVCLLSTHISIAQEQPTPQRKSVGLVLSGGGAKGAAHLRIIKAIEEAGIPIDYIAGTSIGSIIGGLYAVGYTIEEIEALYTSMNWFNLFTGRNTRDKQIIADKRRDDAYMFDISLPKGNISVPSGILRGNKFMEQLNDLLLGYQHINSFDSLPIPFACVAYDINTGSEYVARGGNLAAAIRSSMSIPGVFRPVKYNNMILVDGGVFNNFPVDVVKDMGADIVIGIDLTDGIRSDADIENIIFIFEQLTTFLGMDNYEANKSRCDYYIHPEVAPYTAGSFNQEAVDSLLHRGQREADKHREGLLALREKIGLPDGYMPPKRTVHYSDDNQLKIGNIRLEGFSKTERNLIAKNLDLRPHSTTTRKEFNRNIGKIKSIGGYDYVQYSLANQPPYDLTIRVDESRNTSIHVGFRFDSQELASLLIGTEITLPGTYLKPRIELTARLNTNPYIQFKASSSRLSFGEFALLYRYQYNDFNIYHGASPSRRTAFNLHNMVFRFSDIHLRDLILSASIEGDIFDFRGNGTLEEGTQGHINYSLSAHYDNLDDAYLPTKGWSFDGCYTLYTTNGLRADGRAPFSSVGYEFRGAISLSGWLSLIPSLYGRTLVGQNPTFPYLNFLGGTLPARYMPQQMPFVGIRHIEQFSNSVMVGAAELRANITGSHYISAVGNVLLQNDNFLHIFRGEGALLGFGLKYTYRTSLGPLTILASGTDETPLGGIYLSFGKNF